MFLDDKHGKRRVKAFNPSHPKLAFPTISSYAPAGVVVGLLEHGVAVHTLPLAQVHRTLVESISTYLQT